MNRLVVWDVDGTLTRVDTLVPFLVRLGGTGRTAHALATAARAGRGRAGAKDVVLRECLTGLDLGLVEAAGRRYAEHLVLRRCRRDALRRWESHASAGDNQVLASASLGCYLRPLGALLGAQTVLCTELAAEDGRLTGGRSTANCRGPEKARRVSSLVAQGQPLWVYSDSTSDAASFALADVAVRVRPWRRISGR